MTWHFGEGEVATWKYEGWFGQRRMVIRTGPEGKVGVGTQLPRWASSASSSSPKELGNIML